MDLQAIASSRHHASENWSAATNSWSASVVIGGDGWRIRSEMVNATGHWFCDGTNVFYWPEIHYLPDQAHSPFKLATSIGPYKHVVVIPGTNPVGDFRVNLVWLACCSGSYLRSADRLLSMPGGEPRHDILLWAVEDKTVLSAMPPFLPQRIDFSLNPSNALKATNSILLFPVGGTIHIPSLLTNGVLMASYQVGQFTNYSGWTIPTAFTYVQNEFPEGLPGSGIKYSVTGKVTLISETNPPKPILEAGAPIYVADTRFRDPSGLVTSMDYTLTNGILPATSAPAVLADMEKLAKKRAAWVDSHSVPQ
jgi:hypothetical protein